VAFGPRAGFARLRAQARAALRDSDKPGDRRPYEILDEGGAEGGRFAAAPLTNWPRPPGHQELRGGRANDWRLAVAIAAGNCAADDRAWALRELRRLERRAAEGGCGAPKRATGLPTSISGAERGRFGALAGVIRAAGRLRGRGRGFKMAAMRLVSKNRKTRASR